MWWKPGMDIILVVVMLFFGTGEARVKCYICSTKINETACLYPESYDLPLYHCDQTALAKTRDLARSIDPSYDKIFEVDTEALARHIDLDCLKVVTKLGNKKFTFRGCQLAEQTSLDICYKMKKADTDFLKKLHCSRCSTDRCNSAGKWLSNRVYFCFSVIASLLFWPTL